MSLESFPTSIIPVTENSVSAPWYLQVARGLVPGVSSANIFGYGTVNQSTAYLPIWENTFNGTTGGTYPTGGGAITSTAIPMYLWSSSSSDTTNTILVQGLTTGFVSASEVVTLNGTNHVKTTNNYLRINNLFVTSATAPVGTVNIGPSSTDTTIQYGEIMIGAGKSQQAVYTVPANNTFYLTRVNAQAQSSSGISSYFINYRVQTVQNIANPPFAAGATQQILQVPFVSTFLALRVTPFGYPGGTDLQFQCVLSTGTTATAIGIQVEGVLVSNTTT
jgi:hypothetical protein